MKSFNQFLNECYLSEEEVQGRLLTNRGTAQNFRNPKRIPFTGTDPTPTPASRRLPAGSPEGPRTSPGQMEIPEPKTTKVPGSKVRGETGKGGALALRPKSSSALTTTPKSGALATTSKSSNALATIPKSGNLANKSSSSVVDTSVKPVDVKVLNEPKGKLPSGSKPKALPSGASSVPSGSKAPKAPNVSGKFAKVGRLLGPASAALDTVTSTADERSKGSGWARSLAKGATVAAGGLLGGTAGAIGGGGVLSAATGTAGALAGGAAAEKAFDVAAGANAKQRKQIATANRKSQSGGAIKGVGGPTSFDTKNNTITSGGKTAQLGKTSVVTNPKTGKQEVGNLAYKDGKAVYKRSDTKSLAQTSSNPLERIGRTMFAGAYKKSDAANAAAKLNQARQSDSARNKALGVKMLPGK